MERRIVLQGLAASAALAGFPSVAGATSHTALSSACPDCEERHLFVDLGRAMLYAVEGVRLILVSRVIVGAPRYATPTADSVLSHVRFRPTWRPTPDMVASGRYEDGLRPPGRSNPLGLAAIHFAGGGLVYLHGTNQPHLFERERRSLSNGCVRVETLSPLVGWALGWTPETVEAAMNGRRTFDAPTLPTRLVMTRTDAHPMLPVLARLSDGAAMGLQPG
jgi:murein L,D-transpeptidase YcbB/YkuD